MSRQCIGFWWVGFLLILAPGVWGFGCSSQPTCTKNGDCQNGQLCIKASCQDPAARTCASSGDCVGLTQHCEPRTKQCVVCLQDTHCATNQRCENHTCRDAFKPECRSDSDCAGRLNRFCSGNGKCEWQCRLNSDCSRSQECREHRCEKQANNNFCVTDADCSNNAKRFCSSAGNCEWECKKDADCPNNAACQKNACVPVASGCKTDQDCTRSDQSRCLVSSGQCVQCLAPSDCPTDKPRCVNQRCEANTTTPTDCSQGCAAGELCFSGKFCMKKPTPCQSGDDCVAGEVCADLGDGVYACLPACDPTQNKSEQDRTNASCWNNMGWCYEISDNDPKDGACYPPQYKIRKWKDQCGDESKPDTPAYHLCEEGLSCVDDKGKRYCWKLCDPKKNVGGDPDTEDKNPDCEGGKGTCWPLEGGGGACEPATSTTPSGNLPQAGELVINELLADPAAGTTGDANQDGSRHSYSDEFIEIVNVSQKELTLDGVALIEKKAGAQPVFTFPTGTVLKPKQAAVVFGGGMVQDSQINTGQAHPKFGNALVFTVVKQGDASSSSGLVLSNAGKTMQLLDSNQKILDTFTYGSGDCLGDKDQSVTRSPDLTGSCQLHSTASPAKALFSPGTKSDGKAF